MAQIHGVVGTTYSGVYMLALFADAGWTLSMLLLLPIYFTRLGNVAWVTLQATSVTKGPHAVLERYIGAIRCGDWDSRCYHRALPSLYPLRDTDSKFRNTSRQRLQAFKQCNLSHRLSERLV